MSREESEYVDSNPRSDARSLHIQGRSPRSRTRIREHARLPRTSHAPRRFERERSWRDSAILQAESSQLVLQEFAVAPDLGGIAFDIILIAEHLRRIARATAFTLYGEATRRTAHICSAGPARIPQRRPASPYAFENVRATKKVRHAADWSMTVSPWNS